MRLLSRGAAVCAIDVDAASTVGALREHAAAAEGLEVTSTRLCCNGMELLDDNALLSTLAISEDDVLYVSDELVGAGKKRKKKQYTKPKKQKHKKKKSKLSILKHYKVDDASKKVTRLRDSCPGSQCGPGVFMAAHVDRVTCGKCSLTIKKEAKVGGGKKK